MNLLAQVNRLLNEIETRPAYLGTREQWETAVLLLKELVRKGKAMDGKRKFTWFGGSWYASRPGMLRNDLVDVINFGMYLEDGSTTAELAMCWVDLLDGQPPAARLDSYHDGWKILAELPELIAWLGTLNGRNISPAQFVEKLKELGFEDATQHLHPEGAGQQKTNL